MRKIFSSQKKINRLEIVLYHTTHIKYNIPFNLAKHILIFVSGDQKVTLRLKELRKWLVNCGYPESVIDKSFFNAKLQGPANKPANS